MTEIYIDDNISGDKGNAGEEGKVRLNRKDLVKWDDPDTDPATEWTFAGTLLHEMIFHKHPHSAEEMAYEMQDYYNIPSRPNEDLHDPANSIEPNLKGKSNQNKEFRRIHRETRRAAKKASKPVKNKRIGLGRLFAKYGRKAKF